MIKKILVIFSIILLTPNIAFGMHIMEGYLPPKWALIWTIWALPFVIKSYSNIKRLVEEDDKNKMLLAFCGAFVFVLSALKLPSVTGSSSHPTGVGLGAIIFGPWVMTLLGVIALIFQALLLAHGGITTLGANTFSMAIAGPFVSYYIYKSLKKIEAPQWLSIFLAASLGDLFTYIVTSFQLAIAFPGQGYITSFAKFMGIFAVTQVPLAITEGILTVVILNMLSLYEGEEIFLKGISVKGGIK